MAFCYLLFRLAQILAMNDPTQMVFFLGQLQFSLSFQEESVFLHQMKGTASFSAAWR
jgi:uncharacterized SAM-dependent methyltransferase